MSVYMYVYIHNRLSFRLTKEGHSDIQYNMDEPWGHNAECNKTVVKTNSIWFHLYEVPRVAKLIETESRMVVAKGWGRW